VETELIPQNLSLVGSIRIGLDTSAHYPPRVNLSCIVGHSPGFFEQTQFLWQKVSHCILKSFFSFAIGFLALFAKVLEDYRTRTGWLLDGRASWVFGSCYYGDCSSLRFSGSLFVD
jgi:hypothetical protein